MLQNRSKLGCIPSASRSQVLKSVQEQREGPHSYFNFDADSLKNIKLRYQQVGIGLGKRSDFAKLPQASHDPGYVYQQKFETIENRLSACRDKIKSTFGSPHSRYAKVMVPETKAHYLGKGPGTYLTNDGHDLKLLRKVKGGLRFSKADRGLGPVPTGQLKLASPGPGAY